jgi:hypothetical protein
MEFEPVTDQCAGSIGLRAHVQLSGEPPFRLQYQVTHVDDSKRKRTTKHTKTIMQTRDEILFQPEQVGHFTWEAVKIEDAAYMGSNGVDVKKGLFSGSTEVRPLASAAWKKGSDDIKSCEGKTVSAEVELTVRYFTSDRAPVLTCGTGHASLVDPIRVAIRLEPTEAHLEEHQVFARQSRSAYPIETGQVRRHLRTFAGPSRGQAWLQACPPDGRP